MSTSTVTDGVDLNASTTLLVSTAAALVLYFLYRQLRPRAGVNKDGVFIGRNAPGFQTAGVRKMQVTPDEYRRLTGRDPPTAIARPDLQHIRAADAVAASGSGTESGDEPVSDAAPKSDGKTYDEDWLPAGHGKGSKSKSKARKR